MNGGEIIARVLHKQGVKYLFTLCGGHISPIFVAAQNRGIRVIDTRHEVNAVFAADAVSRLTGVSGRGSSDCWPRSHEHYYRGAQCAPCPISAGFIRGRRGDSSERSWCSSRH
jgi:hypothetical protein